jgi:hypothetical protein
MDDLRPFWAIEPKTIRVLAGEMWKVKSDGISGIFIRDHNVSIGRVADGDWRAETFQGVVLKIAKYLPDMDIAVNRLDQPRVVVPWDDMQALLKKEQETRTTPPEVTYEFTKGMDGLYQIPVVEETKDEKTTVRRTEDSNNTAGIDYSPGWFPAHGKQYMDIAKTACSPESYANNENNEEVRIASEKSYKDPLSGLVTNFNLSSDLCTMGPQLHDKHGFLFTASTILASKRLLPVFGECKVNVNSDILFPANMYFRNDERYEYNPKFDVKWENKAEQMIWRGVTSGGAQLATNWQGMHRHRFVQYTNGTYMQDKEVRILSELGSEAGQYESYAKFKPSSFAENYTDIGFVETWGCIPNCDFYNDVFALKPQVSLSEQFKFKYLADVDGHSFSGRWRAFLLSKGLGFKATIFREWHDSRIFEWRHFAPMDNRFDDFYTLLTYFAGLGSPEDKALGLPYVPKHDFEAKKLANQARDWANKVLRNDDMEVRTNSKICAKIKMTN